MTIAQERIRRAGYELSETIINGVSAAVGNTEARAQMVYNILEAYRPGYGSTARAHAERFSNQGMNPHGALREGIAQTFMDDLAWRYRRTEGMAGLGVVTSTGYQAGDVTAAITGAIGGGATKPGTAAVAGGAGAAASNSGMDLGGVLSGASNIVGSLVSGFTGIYGAYWEGQQARAAISAQSAAAEREFQLRQMQEETNRAVLAQRARAAEAAALQAERESYVPSSYATDIGGGGLSPTVLLVGAGVVMLVGGGLYLATSKGKK